MKSESLYWFIVLLTFLYIVYKNRTSSVKILIILCFYSGLASFFGKSIENPYKIFIVILSIYTLAENNGLSGLKKRESSLLFVFILFSVSFFFSALINEDYLKLILSQYGKYFTPICLFLVLNRTLVKNPGFFINIKGLFFNLLAIQILLSFLKVLTLGMQEYIVGSISNIGGGQATILPILGFILLWMDKHGNFSWKDWFYTLLLLLIGIVSFKRAVLFIMPVFIIIFMYYVPRKLKVRHLLYALPLATLFFYIGVRLNPTLNREAKIGGSFDFKYVVDYSRKYTFGEESNNSRIKLVSGRGGATFSIIERLIRDQPLSPRDYWGTGLKEIYTTDYEEFNQNKFGLNSKGSVTGLFQSYISSGYFGVIATILLLIFICNLIRETRIRYAIGLLMFWDYFFYLGLILRTQSLFILLFFIILFSNIQYEQEIYRKHLAIKRNDKNRNIQPQPALSI